MQHAQSGRQVKKTGAITLMVCLWFLAGAANAAMVYDNLGSVNQGVDSVSDWGPPLFNSFSVGPAGLNLEDVQLLLRGASSPGSVSVVLYANNPSTSPDSPGALLTTIGTLSDNYLPAALAAVNFHLAAPYALAANGRYWLGLDSAAGSTAVWGWSADQDGVGVPGEFYGQKNEGQVYVYPNNFVFEGIQYGPYQMRVVPLPGALLLLGSGLAGLGLWRLRQRGSA